MTKQDIIQAYIKMRECSQLQSIPSEVLEFMKDVSIEKINALETEKEREEMDAEITKHDLWFDEYSDELTWEEFDKKY